MIINNLQNEQKECGGFCDKVRCLKEAPKGEPVLYRMISRGETQMGPDKPDARGQGSFKVDARIDSLTATGRDRRPESRQGSGDFGIPENRYPPFLEFMRSDDSTPVYNSIFHLFEG